MRRWIFLWFAVVLAGCSEPQQESGFAGLAGIADNESGVPFLQPGPGERLSFPEDRRWTTSGPAMDPVPPGNRAEAGRR